ncbi:woronin body major [Fusarium beomiforme]|uniref:Woronin body major n=1 Tax=Fusarium beomiforme TaxID=44412 RepID=A0A9P5ABC3_9HYPO|nr:woronin body major [Fusarium beomiforme]
MEKCRNPWARRYLLPVFRRMTAVPMLFGPEDIESDSMPALTYMIPTKFWCMEDAQYMMDDIFNRVVRLCHMRHRGVVFDMTEEYNTVASHLQTWQTLFEKLEVDTASLLYQAQEKSLFMRLKLCGLELCADFRPNEHISTFRQVLQLASSQSQKPGPRSTFELAYTPMLFFTVIKCPDLGIRTSALFIPETHHKSLFQNEVPRYYFSRHALRHPCVARRGRELQQFEEPPRESSPSRTSPSMRPRPSMPWKLGPPMHGVSAQAYLAASMMDSNDKGKEPAPDPTTEKTPRGLPASEMDTADWRKFPPQHSSQSGPPTITVPCQFIRLGDFVILQDRPCSIIRIEVQSRTGQYCYQGVDLFTMQIYDGYSFTSNPSPGVEFQSLLSPIYKQYVVVKLQDGKVVVETEPGNEVLLPILQASSLYSRLENALHSGRGSVRAVVMEYDDLALAVEMKVISTSPLSAPTNETLHAAAAHHEDSKLEEILSEVKESYGDIDQLNQNGETALDITLSKPTWHTRALRLLEAGASPIAHLDKPFVALLNAAAQGDIEELRKLCEDGVRLNRRDRLGYTALHEAICFGHYNLVEFLINHGADVNATVTHGGDTGLHAAIQRGLQHRSYFQGARARSPRLSHAHLNVMGLLLRKNIDQKLRRSSDHLTAEELLSKELTLPQKYHPIEVCYLQRMLIMLSTTSSQHEVEESSILVLSEVHDSFELQIQFLNSNRKTEFLRKPIRCLFDPSPESFTDLRNPRELVNDSTAKEFWTWVHLPANNKDWAEAAIYQITRNEDIGMAEY